MAIKYLIFIFTFLSLSLGCSQQPLSGHINTKDNPIYNTIYLIEPVTFSTLASSYEGKIIDSVRIDQNGNFSFKSLPNVDQAKMFLLVIQKQLEQYPSKLLNDHPDSSNYIPFIYLSGSHVIINSDAAAFMKNAIITDETGQNNDIVNLIKIRSELFNQYFNQKEDIDEENLIKHEKAIVNYQKELLRSIQHSKSTLIHALALRWASIEGDYERIPELVKEECRIMNELQPSHPWSAQVCQKLRALPLVTGDTIQNFEMPMLNGDTVQLSSLLDSKLTIIDLWASWCGPCRKENKETLVPLWDAFHNKGLQIIGYALDSSHKGWENAINKDGANRWVHSSHLEGDVSPFLDKLKITTIPANYVIDKHGVILAKNLHGDELYQWVAEYLNK